MTSPSASDISLTTSTAATAQEPQGDFAIIARQAILDEQRDVYGYELFDRSTAHDAHTAASDAALPKAKSRIARAVATLPTRGANPASIMKTEAAA